MIYFASFCSNCDRFLIAFLRVLNLIHSYELNKADYLLFSTVYNFFKCRNKKPNAEYKSSSCPQGSISTGSSVLIAQEPIQNFRGTGIDYYKLKKDPNLELINKSVGEKLRV